MVDHLFYSHLKSIFITFKKRTQLRRDNLKHSINLFWIFICFSKWIGPGFRWNAQYVCRMAKQKAKLTKKTRNNLMWIIFRTDNVTVWFARNHFNRFGWCFRLFNPHVNKPNSFSICGPKWLSAENYRNSQIIVVQKIQLIFFFSCASCSIRDKSQMSQTFLVFHFLPFVRKIRFSLPGSTKSHWNKQERKNEKNERKGKYSFTLEHFYQFQFVAVPCSAGNIEWNAMYKILWQPFFRFWAKNCELKSYSPTIFNSFSLHECDI